jgi:hypothetical protein
MGTLAPQDVLFSDVQRWQQLGTVVSSDPYEKWTSDVLEPAPGVFLAGDYTFWDAHRLPYGMDAAVGSGRIAGAAARGYLTASPPPLAAVDAASAPSVAELALVHSVLRLPPASPTELPPLTRCSAVDVGEAAPTYIGPLMEGTVAPYGIVLLGKTDHAIVKALLAERQDGMWEWGRGYGTSPADTALVMEGLLAAGVAPATLLGSLDVLRDKFYDAASGAFDVFPAHTHGRAPYWSGPCNDTTAHVAYLMQRLHPARYIKEIASAVRYLLAHQDASGAWRSKWFPSWVLTTYYAVRLLALVSGDHRIAIERATARLATLQRENGSIADLTIDTALATLTWHAAGTHQREVQKALRWLRHRVARGVPAGEPVLYYRFDDLAQGKAFFMCNDLYGQIAGAWAAAALREATR